MSRPITGSGTASSGKLKAIVAPFGANDGLLRMIECGGTPARLSCYNVQEDIARHILAPEPTSRRDVLARC